MAQRSPVVAVFNTPDSTELLRVLLEEHHGFVVVSACLDDIRHRRVDLEAFLQTHRPAVALYDIAAPFEQSVARLQEYRASGALDGIPIVLTSTYADGVRSDVPHVNDVTCSAFGPYDLYQVKEIVDAVKAALAEQAW